MAVKRMRKWAREQANHAGLKCFHVEISQTIAAKWECNTYTHTGKKTSSPNSNAKITENILILKWFRSSPVLRCAIFPFRSWAGYNVCIVFSSLLSLPSQFITYVPLERWWCFNQTIVESNAWKNQRARKSERVGRINEEMTKKTTRD